ncbi:MAG: hypothetical protein ACI4V3_08595 [Faecousia sp.]
MSNYFTGLNSIQRNKIKILLRCVEEYAIMGMTRGIRRGIRAGCVIFGLMRFLQAAVAAVPVIPKIPLPSKGLLFFEKQSSLTL